VSSAGPAREKPFGQHHLHTRPARPLITSPMKIVSARESVLPIGSLVSCLPYAESDSQILIRQPNWPAVRWLS